MLRSGLLLTSMFGLVNVGRFPPSMLGLVHAGKTRLVPACIAGEGRSFGNWIITIISRLRVVRESHRNAPTRRYLLHL